MLTSFAPNDGRTAGPSATNSRAAGCGTDGSKAAGARAIHSRAIHSRAAGLGVAGHGADDSRRRIGEGESRARNAPKRWRNVIGLFLLFLLFSCGDETGDGGAHISGGAGAQGSGGAGAQDGNLSGATGADTGTDAGAENDPMLTGKIIFDYVDGGITNEHIGVYEYDIERHELRRLAEGSRPRAHESGQVAFLQPCAQAPFEPYYRAALLDTEGNIRPVTPCSNQLERPPEPDSVVDGEITFSYVELSPDGELVLVTSEYSYATTTSYATRVYGLDGEPITTFERSYDSTWMPDGRVLWAYGEDLYLGDVETDDVSLIDDRDVLHAAVNNPAVDPSGERIAFEYNGQIWQIKSDGTDAQMVVYGDAPLRYPTWGPNGEFLLFTSFELGSNDIMPSFFFYEVATQWWWRLDVDDLLSSLWDQPDGPLTWLP